MTNRCYRSCFIVDVQITDNLIRLQDSSKQFYFIETIDINALQSFKQWFKTIFLQSISQTLTLFEYEGRNNDGVSEIYIKKFLNRQLNVDENV